MGTTTSGAIPPPPRTSRPASVLKIVDVSSSAPDLPAKLKYWSYPMPR
jgi:hypothetical protein